MAGGVAEVGSVRGRADIGRNARLVDADNVGPATLDQVMGEALVLLMLNSSVETLFKLTIRAEAPL